MRIGIVTLAHANDNYGGALQAFALQERLRAAGHSPFLANTAPAKRETRLSAFLEHPLREIQKARRYARFQGFWDEKFSFDPQGHRPECEFLETPTPADAYICGSDQIWSNGWAGNPVRRRFAFLDFDFGGSLRIAYSPSWGTADIPAETKPDVSRMLARFDAVSSREESGVAIARACGAAAQWTVDPVFLHGADFWNALAGCGKRAGGKLLYAAYRWKTAFPARRAVAAARRALRLELAVPASERPLAHPFANFMPSPPGWVRAVRDAAFVITNSFHCTAFSIIFKRPFAVLALDGRYAAMNTRIESLCSRLGLEDRIVRTGGDLERTLRGNPDWDAAHARLDAWRAESDSFLRAALSKHESKKDTLE